MTSFDVNLESLRGKCPEDAERSAEGSRKSSPTGTFLDMHTRLPTVYDFSSLRLHPDGSRVQQSTSKNQKLRYAAGVVQDSRGNWFAHDAAGSASVRRYRKVEGEKEGDEEEWNDADGAEIQSSGRKGNGKEKETTGRKSDVRPAKRQKFMQDYDFLTPTDPSGSSSSNSLPSSDLLKSIHYFASSYYHERGQLFNATKEYRHMRKQNRLKRLGEQNKVEAAREDSVELDEDSGQEEANRPRRGGRKKGVTGKTLHRKDMYKMLDGSALMAIGMLVQEYISRTLEVRIPDGWEDMMRNAYIDEEAMPDSHEDGEPVLDEGKEAFLCNDNYSCSEEDLGPEVKDANSMEDGEKDHESEDNESGGNEDDDETCEGEEDELRQDNSEDDEDAGD